MFGGGLVAAAETPPAEQVQPERVLLRLFSLLGSEQWESAASYKLPAGIPPTLESAALCLKAAACFAAGDLPGARSFLGAGPPGLPDFPGEPHLAGEPHLYLAGERMTGLGYLALREGSLEKAADFLRAGIVYGCDEAALGLRAVTLAAGSAPLEKTAFRGGDYPASRRLGIALDAAFEDGEWEALFSSFPQSGKRFPATRQGDILFFGNPSDWTAWITSGLVADPEMKNRRHAIDDVVLAAVRAGRAETAVELVNSARAFGYPVGRKSSAVACLAAGRSGEALRMLLPGKGDDYPDAGILAGLAEARKITGEKPALLAETIALRLPVEADPPLAAAAAAILAYSHPGKAAGMIKYAATRPLMFPRATIDGFATLLKLENDSGRSARVVEIVVEGLSLFPRETWLYIELASASANAGNAAGVVRAVEDALESGPVDPGMLLRLSESCRRAGLHGKAASLLAGIDRETVLSWGEGPLLADWLTAEGRFEEAFELYESLTRGQPGNPDHYLQRAVIGVKLGRPEEAAADLAKWLLLTGDQAPPEHSSAGYGSEPLGWLGRFSAFGDTLDGDCVLETVDRAGAMAPMDPRLACQRALVYDYCGSSGDAAGVLEGVAFGSDSGSGRLRTAARIFRSGGLPENACETLQLLLNKGEASFEDTLSMMVSALEAGAWQVVLHLVDQDTSKPGSPLVSYIEGAAARALGLCDRSIEALRRAAAAAPGDPRIVVELAEASICAGCAFEGELALEAWISAHPDQDDPGFFTLLGRCALETGNGFKAGAMFRMALSVERCSRGALEGLVTLAETRGDEIAAIDNIERFIVCYPRNEPAYRTLAERYRRAGMIDLEVITYERFFAACGGFCPGDMEYLGDLYVSAALPDLAASRYRFALELEPGLLSCLLKLSLVEILRGRENEAAVLLDEFLRRAIPGHPDFETARGLRSRLKGENY